MTDITPIRTLAQRIGTAHDMLQYILKDPANEIDSLLFGTLNGVENILAQAHDRADVLMIAADKAKDAFQEKRTPTPGATVILYDDDEPIDLQEESLDVIREVVKDLEDALICPRRFLKAVDQLDKAAVNATPGEAS